MTRFAWGVALVLSLAGCVTHTLDEKGKPVPNVVQSDSDIRNRARLHTELAAGYFEMGNFPVALDEIKLAQRIDRSYGPAYNVGGLIYSALKEDRLAAENFEEALRIDPLDSDANNNYGLFLCQRKREDEAIRYFLAALRNPLYQNRERSYLNAGLCSRRKGDVAAAEDYFSRALAARPNQPQALYHMADMAYARGDYPLAKNYISPVTQMAASPEVLWLALRTERRLGDRSAEASYGVQLRKNFPNARETRLLITGQYD